jgi:hypothetical protein
MARRYDAEPLPKAVEFKNGWLKAPARVGRVGVQNYRQPDGSIRRELRPPEEVFHKDSLASFQMVPISNEHPGLLDSENADAHHIGHLGENITQDGKFVAANVMFTNAHAIGQLKGGKVQLSAGYTCDVEMKSGVWEGQPYDAVQRNIRANHVALVKTGRAGPDVRVRLDSEDAVALELTSQQSGATGTEPAPMEKIRLDGVDFEVSQSAAQAFAKALKTANDAATTHQARADVAEGKVKELEKTVATATDPAAFRQAVKARSELEATAKDILGNAFKADASDEDIQRAVIGKLAPTLDVKGKDATYVSAAFGTALAMRKPAPAPGASVKADTSASPPAPVAGETRQDTEDPRKAGNKAYLEHVKRLGALWQSTK